MIIKLKATGGEGYDMVVPSDYSVEILRKENLLKKLDKTKIELPLTISIPTLPTSSSIRATSIPFLSSGSFMSLASTKIIFQGKPLYPSWKMIFDPNVIDYKITMLNDPIQTVTLPRSISMGQSQRLPIPSSKTSLIS